MELYAGSRKGWLALRRKAGLDSGPETPTERQAVAAIKRLLHVDDEERLTFLHALLAGEVEVAEAKTSVRHDTAYCNGALQVYGGPRLRWIVGRRSSRHFFTHPPEREIVEVLELLDDKRKRVTPADRGKSQCSTGTTRPLPERRDPRRFWG